MSIIETLKLQTPTTLRKPPATTVTTTKTGKKIASKMKGSKSYSKGSRKKMIEMPHLKLSRTHRFAIYMFTRPNYRIAAGLQMFVLCLLLTSIVLLYIASEQMRNKYNHLKENVENVDRMRKKGINVTLNCEYESDDSPKNLSIFYNNSTLWNTELCGISCGRTAYAFRINRVKKGHPDCRDKMDMVPCHVDEHRYCLSATQSMVNQHLKMCEGKNKQPMPLLQVTGNYKMQFHVALLDYLDAHQIYYDNNSIDNILEFQHTVLQPWSGKRLLAQSLVVRCPKCMVSSRCFASDGKLPPLFWSEDMENKEKPRQFRQLTTLRQGFPYYAMNCDGLEWLNRNNVDSSDACPDIISE